MDGEGAEVSRSKCDDGEGCMDGDETNERVVSKMWSKSRSQLESTPYCCMLSAWLGNGLRGFSGRAILQALFYGSGRS